MGDNPDGIKVNTPKGKYPGKYLFTFGIRFLLEPYLQQSSEHVTYRFRGRDPSWREAADAHQQLTCTHANDRPPHKAIYQCDVKMTANIISRCSHLYQLILHGITTILKEIICNNILVNLTVQSHS